MELHKGQQHSDPVDAEGRSYLSDLLEQIDDLCAERKILLDQKSSARTASSSTATLPA